MKLPTLASVQLRVDKAEEKLLHSTSDMLDGAITHHLHYLDRIEAYLKLRQTRMHRG